MADQLGTPRIVFDKSGSLATTKRHDYALFGEELFNGARPNVPGYAADSTRQKFTQKERDIETGLDYSGARYFSFMSGRFTSPDPLLTSGKTGAPQSWNRYTYCLNNPLAFIDPTGLEWRRNDDTGNIRWYETDDDRTGTTEYTNEYYQSGSQWVHLNMNGPSRNPDDGDFTRRGWVSLDAADVPAQYNPENENAQGLSEDMPMEQQSQGNARNLRELAIVVGGVYNEETGGINPRPGTTLIQATEGLEGRNFSPFLDFHPDHYGGDDYEGQINNTWYHAVVGRPESEPSDSNVHYLLRPPSFFQAFPQRHYFRPSGMHRVDWLCEAVRQCR